MNTKATRKRMILCFAQIINDYVPHETGGSDAKADMRPDSTEYGCGRTPRSVRGP